MSSHRIVRAVGMCCPAVPVEVCRGCDTHGVCQACARTFPVKEVVAYVAPA